MSFFKVAKQSDNNLQRPWVNRRGTVRYQCAPATLGKVRKPPREEFQTAWFQDLSKSGAGVLLARPLSTGQKVILHIASPSGAHRFEFPAVVMHTTLRVTDEWIAGLRFTRELTDDELDSLLYA